MGKVDDSVIAERNALDFIRTQLRLRDRMALRVEMNEVEAKFLKELKAAQNKGEPFELSAAKFVEDMFDDE